MTHPDPAATHVAFDGARRVALGVLQEVLPVLKRRFDKDPSDLVLVFEIETGRQVDFDLRGSLEDVLARALPAPAAERGPGRPRLGVVGREVSLLPRHWAWLEQQPSGASAAIRRLVEHAMKHEPGEARAKQIRASLSRVLAAIAGDRPGYEDALRALFRGDREGFDAAIRRWPKDVRDYASSAAAQAAGASAR
ncbi:MAG: DUF2239 family protein [Polyangiaceae bacterium]